MVRPIEITDTMSKVQAVERLQQNLKAATESVQQFQKELNEKIAGDQVHIANPATQTDRLILHAEERDREKHKTAEDHGEGDHTGGQESANEEQGNPGESSPPTAGHIDIKV